MPKKNFLFSLEALEARHGDALLLHYGDPTSPSLILVDGGPRGVYKARLRARLDALKASRSPASQLPIELAIVSHLDDDHIAGVLDLFENLVDKQDAGKQAPYNVVELWNNTFDDIVGKTDPASLGETAQISALLDADDVPLHRDDAAAVIATVQQGRKLRDAAAKLGVTVNANNSMMTQGHTASVNAASAGKLQLHVLFPSRKMLDKLHVEWDKKVSASSWDAIPASAEVAEYLDTSVYNLSSIVILAELSGKRILLTGDALGSDILDGCARSSLWKGKPPYTVDILKVPHHGSDRNVSTDFFRAIPATHYVISANGDYDNPEMSTLQMIVDARGDDDYTVHITNRKGKKNLAARLTNKLKMFPKAIRDRFVFRDEDEASLVVNLGAVLAD